MNASIVVIVFKFEDAAIYPTNGSILRREEPAGMRDLGSGIVLGPGTWDLGPGIWDLIRTRKG